MAAVEGENVAAVEGENVAAVEGEDMAAVKGEDVEEERVMKGGNSLREKCKLYTIFLLYL